MQRKWSKKVYQVMVNTTEPVCMCMCVCVRARVRLFCQALLIHVFLCLSARARPHYASGQHVQESEGNRGSRLLAEDLLMVKISQSRWCKCQSQANKQLAFSSISPVQTSHTHSRSFSHSVTFRACYVMEPPAAEGKVTLPMGASN